MGVRVRQKNGGKWYLYITHHGKRKAKCVGDSRKAAEEVKRKIEARLVLGDLAILDDRTDAPTFQDYAGEWLNTHGRHNCKPSTHEQYECVMNRHLIPAFSSMAIDAITREQVRQFAYRLRGDLSDARANDIVAVLRAILNQAVDDGMLTNNPASKMGRHLPKRGRQKEIEILSRDDLSHLLDTIRIYRPAFYPFFLLLARTGIRLGEGLALKWLDIDWRSGLIHVQRGVRSGRVSTPKSSKTRKVDMSDQLMKTLQDWQTQCELDAIEQNQEPSEWLFTTGKGKPYQGSFIRESVWRPCFIGAGLRYVNIHVLRHTYASMLIQQGESLAYVRDQLGHASIKITVDCYGHLVPGGNRQAVNQLDDAPVRNLSATSRREGAHYEA